MSSSSFSHANTPQQPDPAASSATDATRSPTAMMGQPPAGQPDPYHRAHAPYAHPDGYPHHAMPYIAHQPPPVGPHRSQPQPPEMMYPSSPPEAESRQAATQGETQTDVGSPPPLTVKRKQPESVSTLDAAGKKRKVRPGDTLDADDVQDLDVGPNGGAKHWTEEEKTRFFTWMLDNDEHWDAFKTRMNTVFRECSNELFPGRKSYTALKSCYHRNLEVFKQVHGFQVFCTNHLRQHNAENPNARQPGVEAMLEAARVAGLNVGNLNVKVIDRWYETGWFDLFKKRYRDDPQTSPSSSSHPMPVGLRASIDQQLAAGPSAAEASSTAFSSNPPSISSATTAHHSNTYAYPASATPTRPTEFPQPIVAPPQPSPTPSQTKFSYLRSSSTPSVARQTPAVSFSTAHAVNGRPHTPPLYDSVGDPKLPSAEVSHVLDQLTSATRSLLDTCASLKELMEQQREESKARTELMRAEAVLRASKGGAGGDDDAVREKEISMEKVTFATELLKTGPQNEEIKKAATECLTKYLMRGL